MQHAFLETVVVVVVETAVDEAAAAASAFLEAQLVLLVDDFLELHMQAVSARILLACSLEAARALLSAALASAAV